ncbi:mechanosensitive ion channel family protein [Methylomonas sp. MgM2]
MNDALTRLVKYRFRSSFMQTFPCIIDQAIYLANGVSPNFQKSRLTSISTLLSLSLLFGIIQAIPVSAEENKATDLDIITAQTKQDTPQAFPVEFMNRHIFTIRSDVAGFTQEEQAASILNRIKLAMEKGGNDKITTRTGPNGVRFVELNGLRVFQIKQGDANPVTGESIDDVAKNAAKNLKTAVHDAREQSNNEYMMKGAGFAFFASFVFYVVCRLIYWGERKIISRFRKWVQAWADKLSVPIHPEQAMTSLTFLITLAKWTLVAMAGYQWATFSLSQFPYTRPWGDQLHRYLINTVTDLLLAIVNALPGLVVIFIIVLLTRFASQLIKAFFAKIESGETTVTWMAEETAKPTRKLSQGLLWLFAFAMAYPYFPGSETEAFRGLSVLVGIMLSIGGSGLVGQAASGLIMIYSRVLRENEYVKIGETEGLVTTVGVFSTKIKTASGEEINIPNSMIGNSITVNSSRLIEGDGVVINTTVTIGYDTPWRQVHGMLLKAARSTPGLLSEPKLFVAQTALSDYYAEYKLSALVERPEIRGRVLTTLHANIQDVFNEYGVQIMSPHYNSDPEEKKWVPKEQWFEPPSEQSADGTR